VPGDTISTFLKRSEAQEESEGVKNHDFQVYNWPRRKLDQPETSRKEGKQPRALAVVDPTEIRIVRDASDTIFIFFGWCMDSLVLLLWLS